MSVISSLSVVMLVFTVLYGAYLVGTHSSESTPASTRRTVRLVARFFFPVTTISSVLILIGEAQPVTGNVFVACMAFTVFMMSIFASLVAWINWNASNDAPTPHDDTLRA